MGTMSRLLSNGAAVLVVMLGLAGCCECPEVPDAGGGGDAAREMGADLYMETGPAEAGGDQNKNDAAPAQQVFVGPVGVFLDPAEAKQARATGKDHFGHYLGEVLAHAGVPYKVLGRSDLTKAALLPKVAFPLLLLPTRTTLSIAEQQAIEAYVLEGGTLVVMAGPSGLEKLLGIKAASPVAEGYIGCKATSPFLMDIKDPLHVFSATPVSISSGAGAQVHADLLDTAGKPTGLAAVTRTPKGTSGGSAWYVAADLGATLVKIQQGIPITKDGPNAPDGTAPVKDGILKTDDGIVLDYTLDRSKVAGKPLFLRPVADQLKELLLRLILSTTAKRGRLLPLLWYWPGDLDAVGVISHDSDGNDTSLAQVLLAALKKLNLESTWCFIQYPDKYPTSLFSDIAAAGGEIALHYDARTPGNPKTKWGETYFLEQLKWLKAKSGQSAIISNKNHYLRWEGWVDAYRWFEKAGIQADHSKGPSKSGNVGFLYGTSHPYFPADDHLHDNRLLDVLSVNLLTQDLALTCAYELGEALVDSALAHHGVAHFLFHPAHAAKPAVAAAMNKIVPYGRNKGLKWWSVARLNTWERQRRKVSITKISAGQFTVTTPAKVDQATFIIPLGPKAINTSVKAGGKAVAHKIVSVLGTFVLRFTLDLSSGATVVEVNYT